MSQNNRKPDYDFLLSAQHGALSYLDMQNAGGDQWGGGGGQLGCCRGT